MNIDVTTGLRRQLAGPVYRSTPRRRSQTVRDRMQFIADSISFSSHLSEPSDARGQAIGLLGQTLAQGVSAGAFGGAFIALGGMLLVALCGVLLFTYARRHDIQPVDTVHAATA